MTDTPLNDRPIVGRLGPAGEPLDPISQREAARLLRAGEADLVFAVPPAVRLRPTADVPAGRGLFLHARQGRLYGNVTFQGPDGATMFHGDDEKALWYLNRGLVSVVATDPPALRFTFAPAGDGHAGDAFYLASKANRCVVCGSEAGLNRHHVVPSVYRRHLPAEVKDHSHHDVVPLCLDCHERYEREADALKAELGRECGVPPHGRREPADRERERAVRYARTLRDASAGIPPGRLGEMRRTVGAWLGRDPVSDADVEAVAALGARPYVAEHGPAVVSSGDVRALVRRWREHFVRTMRPGFLPDHWDVDRPV